MLEQQTPSEERGEALNEERAAGATETPMRGRRGWLSALVAGVALVAVVAVFAAVALGRQGTAAPSQSALGASAASVSWRVYHDPMGLYRIRIPAKWTASVSYGTFTMGNRSGSFSGKIEDVMFSDPAQGKSSAQIMIHAEQITSAFGRQWYCTNWRSEDTSTFNGYRADELQPGTVWLFESYNAHFQVDVSIPGVIVPDNPGGPMIPSPPPPTPTPLPATMVKADRAILATSLASLQPAEKPLTCA